MVVTDMAVIAFRDGEATLMETAPSLKVAEVLAVTEAELVIPDRVPEMKLVKRIDAMRIFNGFEELKAAGGAEVGVSDWIEVTHDRINKFADATCDEQRIHVDQERAKAEMPGGKTIAQWPALTEPDADVHPLGDGPQGAEEYTELWC
jgi:hypothetical protein